LPFLKKSLPYTLKAVLIVSTTYILALSGLATLGLAGYTQLKKIIFYRSIRKLMNDIKELRNEGKIWLYGKDAVC
jgi:hypothetical protein